MTQRMRMLVTGTLPLLAALAGCAPDCGLPGTALDGRRYQAFGNVIEWTTGQTGAPPGATLVNGYTDLEFQWGPAAEGPIVVLIDGQAFDAEGYWNPFECNNFSVNGMVGTFVSRDGTTHNFSAAANFFVYDTLLEGSVAWTETWSTADGVAVGQLQVGDSSVQGRLYP